MSPAAEKHLQGASMARRLAEEYRRDASDETVPPTLRAKWLADAKRAEDRADWYENNARMMQ